MDGTISETIRYCTIPETIRYCTNCSSVVVNIPFQQRNAKKHNGVHPLMEALRAAHTNWGGYVHKIGDAMIDT